MLANFVRFPYWLAVLIFSMLAGCASEPLLITKSAAVPEGVDLSGRWVLRFDPERQRSRVGSNQEQFIPPSKAQRPRRQKSAPGGSVQVFIEYGELLKITQTRYGIFISYDRSVVEEFTFGENRRVNIGPIQAIRVSGWDANSFVVETLDDSRTSLHEAWHLDADDTVLIRDIRVSKNEKETFSMQQVFDRQ